MKKQVLLIAILTLIFTACQKFEPIVDGVGDGDTQIEDPITGNLITSMSDLVIGDGFDWSLIKTLDVQVTLPEDDKDRLLYIYSQDGKRLYFKGHSENGSNVLQTKVTVPTYESVLFLKYGTGDNYPEVGSYISGTNLSYKVSSSLKAAMKTTGGNIDDCDDDEDYNSSTFGGFLFEYDGMIENIDGTSTWTYTVSGVSPGGPDYKDLSHWVLALCEDHTVTTPTTDGWEVNTDPTLDFYGIKWDEEINKEEGTTTFSFTLDDQYDVEPVTVGFKAGTELFYCEIYGPSCESDPDPDPDPEVFGNIAFEDLWPSKGDYDLNDLVIEYDFAVTKDNNEYVQSIEATFLVRCFGAGLHNSFGFTFPNVDPSDIVSVTGYDIVNNAAFTLNANGTEAGQSKATFILYDDTYRLMQHPGSGTGVNTEHPHPYVAPVTLTMNIVFANQAVTYSQLDIGNFNPFIVKHQERAVEIHLPDYPPTDLADPSFYKTFDDDTNPPSKYYLTQDNLPWAIMIPERFDYPIEFQTILGAYNHFAEWAQSDGTLYPDWYLDESGYRNESVIY